MLYLVKMKVEIPYDADAEKVEKLKAEEKAYSQALQREGKWPHIWRVTGKYENYSIFDVESNDELHDILMKLPLLPFLSMEVSALSKHPSSIK